LASVFDNKVIVLLTSYGSAKTRPMAQVAFRTDKTMGNQIAIIHSKNKA